MRRKHVDINVGRDMYTHPPPKNPLENRFLRKESMKNLSANVGNCALSLKVWLGETLLYFRK